jgi:hypothetical protein
MVNVRGGPFRSVATLIGTNCFSASVRPRPNNAPSPTRHRRHPDTVLIRVWMRTAVRKEVTSFGTFLSTLCHEFCHHLDLQLFKFPDSWHTRGFYERAGTLYHHARRTPRKRLFWVIPEQFARPALAHSQWSRWNRFVNLSSFQFLGKISYGIYLTHMLIFEIVEHFTSRYLPSLQPRAGHFNLIALQFCISGSLTIALAIISRWYFE